MKKLLLITLCIATFAILTNGCKKDEPVQQKSSVMTKLPDTCNCAILLSYPGMKRPSIYMDTIFNVTPCPSDGNAITWYGIYNLDTCFYQIVPL